MNYIQSIDIGPFNAIEAEWLAERAIDSKQAMVAFEQLFSGEISVTQFLTSFQYLVESLHMAYQEEQRESDEVFYA